MLVRMMEVESYLKSNGGRQNPITVVISSRFNDLSAGNAYGRCVIQPRIERATAYRLLAINISTPGTFTSSLADGQLLYLRSKILSNATNENTFYASINVADSHSSTALPVTDIIAVFGQLPNAPNLYGNLQFGDFRGDHKYILSRPIDFDELDWQVDGLRAPFIATQPYTVEIVIAFYV
jgi:hypothetical protein